MLEKFIKKDRNEQLESILEEKQIDERARNLLQGILYKIEVSYKDYKKAKVVEETEEKYVQKILQNIKRKCNQIQILNLSEKVGNEEIQKDLEKNKFYIDDERIIAYPIEEKILYAIEKKSNNQRIVNTKYGTTSQAISNLINTGKNIDRVEVLRDFNGWSWTTIKNEIESIEANLVFQILRMLMGENFLDGWCQDTDGIIDYFCLLNEEMNSQYGENMAIQFKDLLIKIAFASEANNNREFSEQVEKKLKLIQEKLEAYKDIKEYIGGITQHKKEALKEIREIDKILSQDKELKAEYEKRNAEAPIEKKIFSIRVLKQLLIEKKQKLLNQIEEDNYMLNPANYLEERNNLISEKKLLEISQYSKEQKEEYVIQFIEIFLKCFDEKVKRATEQEEIMKMFYQFRYFMVLPFNSEKNVKDVEQLETMIDMVEKRLLKNAVEKKVITNAPLEVIKHIFETRIIILEELYYKITSEAEKYYVQIFDENISEEKFEIIPTEKTKINKKMKIFI